MNTEDVTYYGPGDQVADVAQLTLSKVTSTVEILDEALSAVDKVRQLLGDASMAGWGLSAFSHSLPNAMEHLQELEQSIYVAQGLAKKATR